MISEFSRYKEISLVEFWKNKQRRTFMERRVPVSEKELSPDRIRHRVEAGETLDLIAFDYFDSRYWHLIAEVNDIINPFDVKPGTLLWIPSEEDFELLR
jgi:nucleoid-associated protein YgaU